MDRYFEIVNCDKVRGGSDLVIAGVIAGYKEWINHNFLPRNGIVGHLVGEGSTAEGDIYILECAPNILVPILLDGVKEVPRRIFDTTWRENIKKGQATQKEIEEARTNEMISSIMNNLGF